MQSQMLTWKLGKGFMRYLVMGSLIALVCTEAVSVEMPVSVSRLQHATVAVEPVDRVVEQAVPFSKLGAYSSILLRGLGASRTISFGVRKDEVVVRAKLKLNFSYSPSLIYPLSHIKVTLNDEVVATIVLNKEDAGVSVTREINLDPRFLTDFNKIGLQLIAHYTVDHCEDPAHSSLWADISPTSELVLAKSALVLPDDLALLPAPFFDRRDNGKVILPFVLQAKTSVSTLRSAGVVASWFGALADYRKFGFPVVNSVPADSHAIVFVTPTEMPEGLSVPPINGPAVAMIANPKDRVHKLLLVMGRNAEELKIAANALVMGHTVLSGSVSQVETIDLGEPRKPYDAPRWIPVNRPVMFSELVSNPTDLQASGFTPEPIRIGLRVPADLYGWNDRAVPLNFKYRHTPPSRYNDSVLNVDINDQLVKSYRLQPRSAQDSEALVGVPLLSGNDAMASSKVHIPALQVGSNNQLQFRFRIDSEKTGLCTASAGDAVQAAVDPDSTIDFSGFSHYAAMPNLAFFANSGYPFTRLADLADTAIVVPDVPAAAEAEALLTMLGHMGKWTGMPALRVSVVAAADVASVKDKNLLLISTGSASKILRDWSKFLPAMFVSGHKELRLREQRPQTWLDQWVEPSLDALQSTGQVVFGAGGSIAALLGFESPLRDGSSIVAMVASEPERLSEVLDALADPEAVAQIHGDVAIIHHHDVESLRLGDRYFVGDLPWYARIWVRIFDHPVLMAFAGALAGLVVALAAFVSLRRIAARRTGG
jgi:hypothetical protein